MRQALELALEALELHGQQYPHMVKGYCLDAITAIKESLAQPEQEPVAWMCSDFNLMHRGYSRFSPTRQGEWNIPLYTTPPRREWVGLTDDELIATYESEQQGRWGDHVRGLRAVEEAAHGIKE